MDCNTCKEKKKAVEPVPYIAHEAEMARMERANKRLWIVVIILIAALILSNAAWIYRESQFETVETTTTTVEQDADDEGSNNYYGGDYYGSSESDKNDNETPSP
jgi:hypothetical protein